MPGRWANYRTDGTLIPRGPTAEPVLQVRRSVVQPNVDLRSLCSPVDDQKTLGSCSACAVVGSLELQERKQRGPQTELSILYVFYNARQLAGYADKSEGIFIHHAVASILAHGVCDDALWPYDVDKVLEKPPQATYDNGDRRQAIQFARVSSEEGVLMQLLSEKQPVMFASFFEGDEMNAAATTGHMPVYSTRPRNMGGHSMLLVGYDQRKREWLVRNSWGDDYGMKGYLWIPFETLKTYTNPNLYWTIGALDSSPTLMLQGPTMEEMKHSVIASARSEAATVLPELRKSLGKELQADADDAKKSIRDRLRQTEDKLNQRRDGGDGGEDNR